MYSGEDDPQLASERRKPQLPVQFSVTANFTLIRFISHPRLSMNEQFMNEWVTYIKKWLSEGIKIYLFVNCPTEDMSPNNARYFQQLLEENGVEIPPLPWTWNNLSNSNQLSLW